MPDKPRILIADDNEPNRELLEAYLAGFDCETAIAVDGQDTLAKTNSFQPDLILLDVMMPKLSGFEVCQKLKSDPATRKVMILMVTALNEAGDIERAVKAGTNDFVSKPVNKVELLKRVENALYVKDISDENERLRRYIERMEEGKAPDVLASGGREPPGDVARRNQFAPPPPYREADASRSPGWCSWANGGGRVIFCRMETSLHRQLKALYAGQDARVEERLAGFRYRIDAVRGDQLVEIQHGSLAAIRDKIRRLVERHEVLVVKPLVVKKTLVGLSRKGGKELTRKLSPKRGSVLDLFDELVYFTRVFPHTNLTIEAPLVEIEERRYPGHGRRRRWRQKDFQVEDQRLVAVVGVERFHDCADLWRLIPEELTARFHTGHLAEALGVRRWVAQRIAYCLRKTGAASVAGKQGNAWLYERAA